MDSSLSSIYDDLALPVRRQGQDRGNLDLPEGTVLVSADNHWSLSQDIFYERFPARLRHLAPRISVSEEGYVEWSKDGKALIKEANKVILRAFESLPGCVEMDARMRDLDAEGVAKEIAFPNGILALLGAPQMFGDDDILKKLFQVYNEYLVEQQSLAPGRFYGVGLVDFWSADIAETISQLKKSGIKTLMLPNAPKNARGEALTYADPSMALMWEAIEDSELPVCFHIGEQIAATEKPGSLGATLLVNLGPLRHIMGQLIFGGILDRCPRLKVVLCESDINWIPGAMQTADMIYKTHASLLHPKINNHPRHYWDKNFYATFMSDPVGLKMIDDLGADKIMWSTDYPHIEGVFGRGWSSVREVLDHTTADQARKILGSNAIDVFRLT